MPLLPSPPTSTEAAGFRVRVAVAALRGDTAELESAFSSLNGCEDWLRLPKVPSRDADHSLAEEQLLLAAALGRPDPAPHHAGRRFDPALPERSGYRVADDATGELLPVVARACLGDPDRARQELARPARLLGRVYDLLLRADVPPELARHVRAALVAEPEGSDPAGDEVQARREAVSGASPALRARGIAALMRTEARTIQVAGFKRELRAEIEVLVGELLAGATSPPDAGARLDHEVRRHLGAFERRFREEMDPFGSGLDRATAVVVEAMLANPFYGGDGWRLADILRVYAERGSQNYGGAIPREAPHGYGLESSQVRYDARLVISLVRQLPRPPPTELVDALRRLVERIADEPPPAVPLPAGESPPGVEIALSTARALADRGSWLARLTEPARSNLIAWMSLGPWAGAADISAAVYADRASLSAQDRATLAVALPRWAAEPPGESLPSWCLVALSALDALPPDAQEALVPAVASTPETWRLGLLRQLAETTELEVVRLQVGDALLALLLAPESRALHGPGAALVLALVRTGRLPPSYRDAVLDRLPAALRRHPRVVEELSRVASG